MIAGGYQCMACLVSDARTAKTPCPASQTDATHTIVDPLVQGMTDFGVTGSVKLFASCCNMRATKANESSAASNVHRFLTIILLLSPVLSLAAQNSWQEDASLLTGREGTNTAAGAQSDSLVCHTKEGIDVPMHLCVMRHHHQMPSAVSNHWPEAHWALATACVCYRDLCSKICIYSEACLFSVFNQI
jgi:hypothetical protein